MARSRPAAVPRAGRDDEDAGAREAFEDAALYDFEYRRRRADVAFYRRLARARRDAGLGGPILDAACGTGRLLVPLLRDGHAVIGFDRSAAMLARAASKIARLPPSRRARALLLRADLRAFAVRPRCGLVIAAFHSLQHLYDRGAWLAFLRAARRALRPDGLLAFDLLPPSTVWLARDPERRWARTRFRHPATGQHLEYSTNHRYDPVRRVLHMRLYYQRLDGGGRPDGPEVVRRLAHKQLFPSEINRLLRAAGFVPRSLFGDFQGRLLASPTSSAGSETQHVYVAARRSVGIERGPRRRRVSPRRTFP